MPQGPTANARRELRVRKASGRGFVPATQSRRLAAGGAHRLLSAFPAL